MIIPKEGSVRTRADVKKALQASSDCVNVLCMHPNINMWSRMKPVRIANPFPSRAGRWWRGDNSNCGIDTTDASTTSWTRVSSLYTADKMNGYKYQRVMGGASQPLRLADFRGYKSDAVPPVLDFVVTEKVSRTGAAILKAQYAPSTPDYDLDSPGSLTLGEIGGFSVNGHSANLGDLYFGVVIMQGSAAKKYITTDKTGWQEVSVSVADLTVGEYQVYPFFSSVYQDGKQENVGRYYSLPNVIARSFKLIETNVTIEIDAEWHYKAGTYNKDYISYRVYVTQDISSNYHLTNNSISARFSDKSDGAPLDVYEYRNTIPDINVSQGSRVFVAEGRFNGPWSPNQLYNLRVSMNGGTYKAKVFPREDFQPIH